MLSASDMQPAKAPLRLLTEPELGLSKGLDTEQLEQEESSLKCQ